MSIYVHIELSFKRLRQEKDPTCSPEVLGLSLRSAWPCRCLSALCILLFPACLLPQALEMLVKMMHVHSAVVIRAILDQLCHSSVLEVRARAAEHAAFSKTRTGLGDEKERLPLHASDIHTLSIALKPSKC